MDQGVKFRATGALSCKLHVESVKEGLEADVWDRSGETKLWVGEWEAVEPTGEAVERWCRDMVNHVTDELTTNPQPDGTVYKLAFKGPT